jgi:hypothetical protein
MFLINHFAQPEQGAKKCSSTMLLVVFIVFFSSQAYGQDYTNNTMPENLVRVQIGINLLNITDINGKEETMDFDAAVYLRWHDPRLAFIPDSADKSPPTNKLYLDDFQIKEIFSGWRPSLLIPNGIGNRHVNNMMLRIQFDGWVEYVETFQATVETPMDLRLFPFDKQHLEIYLHPFMYNRSEVIFVPDNSLSRTWNHDLGIASWTGQGVSIHERPTEIVFFDDSIEPISEVVIGIDVGRRPWHIMFGIIFPMLILVALTWVVFWMDDESVANRINVSFVGILSVVAYDLVLQENIPEINYITLMDAYIVLTFISLAASVVISLMVDRKRRTKQEFRAQQIDTISRWLFPGAYFSILIALSLIFFAVY